MKKTIIASTVAIVLGATASGLAVAKGGDFGGEHSPVDRMSQQLQLTDEQKTQLEELFAQKREMRQQMRDQMQTEIDSILTPEQIEMKKQMLSHWGGEEGRGHHHRDGNHGHNGQHEQGEGGRGNCR